MMLHKSVTNKWTPWFAWYPVRLQDGRLVWLETVQRKLFHENRIPSLYPSSWIIYQKDTKD